MFYRVLGAWVVFCSGFVASGAALAEELQPPGFRPLAPGVHALVGARVFTRPGQQIDEATIVIRDGLIEALGPDVRPPVDARVWDAKGRTIYPGFIDPYVVVGGTNVPVSTTYTAPISSSIQRDQNLTAAGNRFFGVAGQELDPGPAGPGHESPAVTPDRRLAQTFPLDSSTRTSLRELGFAAANLVPHAGIIRGQSAVVLLGDVSPNQSLLRADVAQHVSFTPGAAEGAFPDSLMGVIALLRQTWMDAGFQRADEEDYAARPGRRARPRFNSALTALHPTLRTTNRQPVVFETGSVLMLDRAARMARELGLEFQLVASGQEWRRPDLLKGLGVPLIVPVNFPALPKLPREADWEDLSLDQLRQWDWATENPAVIRRGGIEVALTTYGLGDRKDFRKNLRAAIDRGLSETDALAALTTVPARLCGVIDQLGSITLGKPANLTITDSKGYFDPEGKILAVWIDGRIYESVDTSAVSQDFRRPEKKPDDKELKKRLMLRELAQKRVATDFPMGRSPRTNFAAVLIRNATVWTCGPLGVLTNASLYIRDGRVELVGQFDLEIERSPDGSTTNRLRISGIVAGENRQSGAIVDTHGAIPLVIDGRGLHLTPGLIDCHSHSMILGAVNEASLPSTAMVRISDVVNSESANIHLQLAGGLTMANLLHGSANPIGGQNCVIKLRDGALPEDLKYTNAPAGIKFALGENVKQSNWGEKQTTRFPQTRMGIGTFFQNRFTAAVRYQQERAIGLRPGESAPLRRDLELEALVEILEGSRLIHCHSYRQDEILNFLRVMEGFGVRVATLQHVLEGYKVADEIARHGAGASAFADWWAYKFEVFDAIPHGGSLMRERGVLVSFNSDSNDHARRLNLEASKAVKYGGTSEVEALKFVTINPARQLGIDRWVGSLEPGKDGDFAVWSGPPLDSSSVCVQTWIDGAKYFDRAAEPGRVESLRAERLALLAKAKKLTAVDSEGAGGTGKPGDAARALFFVQSLERAENMGALRCEYCLFPR